MSQNTATTASVLSSAAAVALCLSLFLVLDSGVHAAVASGKPSKAQPATPSPDSTSSHGGAPRVAGSLGSRTGATTQRMTYSVLGTYVAARPHVYVAATVGVDTETCGTKGRPCRSLHGAVAVAPPYAAVIVAPGDYPCGVRVLKPLLFIADPPSGPTSTADVEAAASRGAASSVVQMDCRNQSRALWFDGVPAHVEGFTFRNGRAHTAGCVLVTMASDVPDEANNFTRCHFEGCTGIAMPVGEAVAAFHRFAPGPSENHVAGAVAIIYRSGNTPGTTEFDGCNFTHNSARGDSVTAGGLAVTSPALAPSRLNQSETTVQRSLETPERNYFEANSAVRSDYDVSTLGRSRQEALSTPFCEAYLLDEVNRPVPDAFAGLYTAVRDWRIDGRPVYNNVGGNIPQTGRTAWLAFCEERQNWGFFSSIGHIMNEQKLNHCECEVCSADRTPGYPDAGPDAFLGWTVARGNLIDVPVPVTCQEGVRYCPAFHVHNAPAAQQIRAGIYAIYPGTLKNHRPVFRRVDVNRSQWVWWCFSSKEWIMTDNDPRTTNDMAEPCSRGIASGPSYSSHPIEVHAWRYWSDPAWKTSPAPRYGGIGIQCAQLEEGNCDAVTFVNPPTAETPVGPYTSLRTNPWAGRPVYASTEGHWFLWYCSRFGEWMVSPKPPPTWALSPAASLATHSQQLFQPPEAGADDEIVKAVNAPTPDADIVDEFHPQFAHETCVRGLSSRGTVAAAPDSSAVEWVFINASDHKWVAAGRPAAVRCAAHCRDIVLNVLHPDVPTAVLPAGNYQAVGTFNEAPMYRRLQHPPVFLLRVAKGVFAQPAWILTANPMLRAITAQDVLVVAEDAPHPLAAMRWRFRRDADSDWQEAPIALQCAATERCVTVAVSGLPSAKHNGVFHVTNTVHNSRPTYSQLSLEPTAVCAEGGADEKSKQCTAPEPRDALSIYFHSSGRWVVGNFSTATQRGAAAWVAASDPTWTYSPVTGVFWNATAQAKGPKAAATVDDVDVHVTCLASTSPDETAQRVKRSGRRNYGVLEGFKDCTFTSNHALGLAIPGDYEGMPPIQAAAGAVLVALAPMPLGTERTINVRRSVFLHNAAYAHSPRVAHDMPDAPPARIAGGLAVVSRFRRRHVFQLLESVVSHNQGHTGGLIVDGVFAGVRGSSVRHNVAHLRGGGMAAFNTNFTLASTVCSLNSALLEGGCCFADGLTRLLITRSELVSNSAGREGTMVAASAHAFITESKIDRMQDMAIAAVYLSLVTSELSCLRGVAQSHVGGFGCADDHTLKGPKVSRIFPDEVVEYKSVQSPPPPPDTPSSNSMPPSTAMLGAQHAQTSHGGGSGYNHAATAESANGGQVPIDDHQARLMWLSNAASLLAQSMLTLTMVIFGIQHFLPSLYRWGEHLNAPGGRRATAKR